jgi:zinc protease
MLPPVRYTHSVLENGLHVFLHEDHAAPVVAVVIMYHAGSKNENPKRTGLAHLIEHLMFKGSEHVADGEHFRLLQEIGANINGTTNEDRTNYFEVVPRTHLELAIYMESDRMGFFLPSLTQEKLDNQRDVVKNERRQNYDNQPYGTAFETITAALFPPDHPYHWPVIGSMEDLSAASLEDVTAFLRKFYSPDNACISVAGDFDPSQAITWIEEYFRVIPAAGKIERPAPVYAGLSGEKRIARHDRVLLPRLYLAWPSAQRGTRDDALLDLLTTVLSSGKSSRLYRSLVYEQQIAQSVSAYQDGAEIAGMTVIEVTAKPERSLNEMEEMTLEELKRIRDEGVTPEELQGALNNIETRLVYSRSTALAKGSALASFFTLTGDAENFNREPDRYAEITPEELRAAAQRVFTDRKVALSIIPEERPELTAKGGSP